MKLIIAQTLNIRLRHWLAETENAKLLFFLLNLAFGLV